MAACSQLKGNYLLLSAVPNDLNEVQRSHIAGWEVQAGYEGKFLYQECSAAAEQAAHGDHGIFVLGGFQDLTGKNPQLT